MNIIGIYSGIFQPPVKTDYLSYLFLRSITGDNTFIVASDIVNLPNSPLNYQDKQQIWVRHGVPADKIVKVKNPSKISEIISKFGSDRTIGIFAMDKKSATIALNNPSGYFINYTGINQLTEPLNKHAYVVIIPQSIEVQKIPAKTIKQFFISKKITPEQKKSFFISLFGWYDISLYELINDKFSEASIVKERVILNENDIAIIKRTLKPFIREVIGQLTTPQGDANTTQTPTTSATPTQSPSDVAKAARLEKEKNISTLKSLEKQLDLRQKKKDNDRKQGEVDVKNLRTQISNVKKQI